MAGHKFKTGMRVVCVEDRHFVPSSVYPKVGEFGRVCDMCDKTHDIYVGVCWDRYDKMRLSQSMKGKCNPGHGMYVLANTIQRCKP